MSISHPATNTTFFPGGNCNGNLVPSAATAGWCLKQNGHPRMQICCTALGNGTVFVQDSCSAWCDVSTSDAFGDFMDCLEVGNGTYNGDLSCSNGETGSANETASSSSGDDDTSGSGPAYDAPRATVFAVLVGVLALSALCL